MKVTIKNNFFSLGGSSSVKDEANNPVFKVKGKVFSITHKKRVCDLNGKVLYTVRNKWINWFVHKAFIYNESKEKIATVKDKLFNIHKEYFIQGYKDEIYTEGRFFSLSCKIYKNGKKIGTISRPIVTLTDTFVLEANEEDMPFLIALVIAMDNIIDSRTAE